MEKEISSDFDNDTSTRMFFKEENPQFWRLFLWIFKTCPATETEIEMAWMQNKCNEIISMIFQRSQQLVPWQTMHNWRLVLGKKIIVWTLPLSIQPKIIIFGTKKGAMNRFWTSSLNSERNMMANNSHTQQESVVLAETFEHHWQQLKSILNNVSVFSSYK